LGISSAWIRLTPRQVAARPGETGDEADCNRVGAGVEEDRDRRGRLLCSQGGRVAALGDDYVDLAGSEVGGQCGKPVIMALGTAVFDRHVLTLDIAGLAQPLSKSGKLQLNHRVHGGLKRADETDHRQRLLLPTHAVWRKHSGG
jgi:hypothetical protein